MSERERWIVYPLLFLALGASLRDKLAKQTRTKQIVCEQLHIVDANGQPMAELVGDRLRLDKAGVSFGYVTANVVDAHALLERGKPVKQGGGVPAIRSLPQLLQYLQRLGVPLQRRATPAPPATRPPDEAPRPGAAPADAAAEPAPKPSPPAKAGEPTA